MARVRIFDKESGATLQVDEATAKFLLDAARYELARAVPPDPQPTPAAPEADPAPSDPPSAPEET